MTVEPQENIIDRELADLFRTKYGAFAVSSNARAIPDARDGLKPIHRRLLYQAKSSAPSTRGTVKSAKIVGDTLGNYHPHGDASVYDAMTRMTRDFQNNVPLIYGHGNMGAIDGSGAAAPRYTEAKLEAAADWLALDGVDEGAVPHSPNYDGRLTEPELLPVKLPIHLLNGVPGGSIGVGFASQVPPHNAAELAKACKYVLQCMADGAEADLGQLMKLMPGPDFPTGGLVGSAAEIAEAYRTGQGSLKVRADVAVECSDSGRVGDRIVVTAIPFGLTTDSLVEEIADAAFGKRDPKTKGRGEPTVPEVKDVRDETTKDRRTKQVKVRIVIDLKQGEDGRVALEKLLLNTRLQTTFSVNMTLLDDGQPSTLGVIEAITRWANFRAECVRRQSAAELERVRDREHVVKGLLAAAPKIDKVIKVIREAKDEETANAGLRALIPCTSKQADAILAMQLRRLTGLRQDELSAEATSLSQRGEHLLRLLTDQTAIIEQMEGELDDVVAKLGRPRRTQVVDLSVNADPRALVVEENCLVSVTGRGYLKRLPADEFRVQNRNTKGKQGAKVKADDVLQSVEGCSSHDRLFAVTDGGAVIRLEAHEIPVTSGAGRHAANLGFEDGELVKGVLVSQYPVPEQAQAVFATVDGEVKRTLMSELDSRVTKRLVFYKSAAERDIAGAVQLPTGSGDVFLASAHGQGTRFSPEDVRLSKRDSGGVRGMDLREDDAVVSIGRIDSEDQLILVCTSDGIGKRVPTDLFPTQGRGGKGRILLRPRPGAVLVQALIVRNSDTVLIATKNGHTVRIRVGDVRELGRSAMGVKLVALNEGDRVVSAAILPADE